MYLKTFKQFDGYRVNVKELSYKNYNYNSINVEITLLNGDEEIDEIVFNFDSWNSVFNLAQRLMDVAIYEYKKQGGDVQKIHDIDVSGSKSDKSAKERV